MTNKNKWNIRLYSGLMALYYISSGVFLYHWGKYGDWFCLVMYFIIAGFGLCYQVIYTKEIEEQAGEGK